MKSYDLRRISPDLARPLYEQHHAFRSVGRGGFHFGLYESDRLVAAFNFLPPLPAAARAVCPSAPWGVLALSRMVAVPKHDRATKSLADVLRWLTTYVLDRTRYPVLIAYADLTHHEGGIYEYAGWQRDGETVADVCLDESGARRGKWSNTARSVHPVTGQTTLRRYVHRIVPVGSERDWLEAHGHGRPIPRASLSAQLIALRGNESRRALAAAAGIDARAVAALEGGGGNLSTLTRLLSVYAVTLTPTPVEIAAERHVRGVGTRTLARLAGVARPSLIALETTGQARVATYLKVCRVLDLRPLLVPADSGQETCCIAAE